MNDDDTLEIYKLIISVDEVESEAKESISSYLMGRAATYGNNLGFSKMKVRDFSMVQDGWSRDYILTFSCHRSF
jgi:hypothetical protein